MENEMKDRFESCGQAFQKTSSAIVAT